MIFCKQCGTQLQDGAVFCRKCGTKVGIGNENAIHPFGRDELSKNNYNSTINKSKSRLKDIKLHGKNSFKKVKSKVLEIVTKCKEKVKEILEKSKRDKKVALKLKIGIVTTGILLIGVIALLVMDKRVSIEKYIVVDVSGYNTLGYVNSYMINREAFGEKVMGKKSEEMEWEEKIGISRLLGTIKLSIEDKEELSNGDKVVVNIEYDNEIAHEYGIKLVGDSYTFTVSGLVELREYNPFENLQVYFSGAHANQFLKI